MELIDTHVHINFDQFDEDIDAVALSWRSAGVVQLVHSCCHPKEFGSIRALAERFPELSVAVGMHPLEAAEWTEESATEIRQLATSPKVVAIGETGLDFYKAENHRQQQAAFESQLLLASELNLAVIVHCRDAARLTAEMLRSFQRQGSQPLRGVMHCWGGTPEETKWFLDLGFYISFSGIVTFKNAHQVQASAKMVPSDRITLETDCPFLAPVPRRGKRNEPAYVRYVADCVAELRTVPKATLAAQTTKNARECFWPFQI
ncbi:TatD family hydrolase [[Phormidium] sp. ETS-05]|uniref:TatD family hydrolase n=1 Tax=[Phormidium] sp. ETS-05 TaxID=222819 RepID=UPI0018EEDCD6|nr:TatD family hydrolase [[Phormidium] sp. ETS-05]